MMQIKNMIKFKIMSFVHETLFGVFRDPYKVLNAAGILPSQNVLEVGCGPGFFTIPAATIVGENGTLLSIDICPLAIRRTNEKIKRNNVVNVKTMLADAAKTGLKEKSFDLVFLFGFIHSVGNLKNILIELHRILKDDGTLSVEGSIKISKELFKLSNRQRRIHQYRKIID